MGHILNLFLKNRRQPPNDAGVIPDTESLKQRSSQAKKNNENAAIPAVLLKRIITSSLVCVVVTAVVIGLVIGMKDTTFCFGFVFSLYLAYVAVSTWYDYKNGKIDELVLACVSVTSRLSTAEIIMEDVVNEKSYRFYEAKKNCPFVPGMVYTVYVNQSNPNKIMEYECQ